VKTQFTSSSATHKLKEYGSKVNIKDGTYTTTQSDNSAHPDLVQGLNTLSPDRRWAQRKVQLRHGPVTVEQWGAAPLFGLAL